MSGKVKGHLEIQVARAVGVCGYISVPIKLRIYRDGVRLGSWKLDRMRNLDPVGALASDAIGLGADRRIDG
jgi:hypothetical protein